MKAIRHLLAILSIGTLLTACSNKDDSPPPDTGSAPPPAAPARGDLVQNPPTRLASLSEADLLAKLAAGSDGAQIVQLFGEPSCRVDAHYLQYYTVGPAGESITDSGALMVPSGSAAECQGPRPILLYAHGTTTDRAANIADLNNSGNAEGLLIAAVFASHGYIVVAPNYAGYDTSTLSYHPYLHADQSAKDMIDALTAARRALPTSFAPATTDNGKLFITGYSQGGHVAMATHRAMQAASMTVTASAPMSGPYALAAFSDAVFYGEVSGGAPVFLTMLITGYQHAYGNIYSAATDVFEARYASGIDTLLPTTVARSTLYSEGKLPQYQLFSSTPPDPMYAAYTPPTTPAEFAWMFALGFGPDNLITNAYRLAYLNDAQVSPDGGWPTTTNGLPAANPVNTLRQAFKANDLRNWAPTSPVLLCAGDQDPTVFYLNTQLMQGYWAASGTNPPVTVLDVDSAKSDGDPYADIKTGFAALKNTVAAAAVAGGATDGGVRAVAEAYHSTLVPPFCLSAVRSKFNGL
ncbi:MAG TPA: prolyl oligopeptidase family serine peptidase [Povalibacter sp.]|nr:prolyl oligopeptidase family serine peptidase [Povalibacter sp.]